MPFARSREGLHEQVLSRQLEPSDRYSLAESALEAIATATMHETKGAMGMLEVKSVPNLLGTPVSYAYAVKAGPWIFLTGHEAFDFESGIPGEVAGPSGFPLFGQPRSRREGDFILQRMRRQEFGSDLGNGFRFETWVR